MAQLTTKKLLKCGIIVLIVILLVASLCYFIMPINARISWSVSRLSPMTITLSRPELGGTVSAYAAGFLENQDFSMADKNEIYKLLSKCKLKERGVDIVEKGGSPASDFTVSFPLSNDDNGKERRLLIAFWNTYNTHQVWVTIQCKANDGTFSYEEDGQYDLYWLDEDITELHKEFLARAETLREEAN